MVTRKQEIERYIHKYYFQAQKKGPIIYLEDKNGHLLSDKMKLHILFDPEESQKEMEQPNELRGDRYFTQKDLIIRTNTESDTMIVWSVKSDNKNSELPKQVEKFGKAKNFSLLH